MKLGLIRRKGTMWFWLHPTVSRIHQWREWQSMCRKYKRKVNYRAFLKAEQP